jgi:hypothetical protein
VSETKIQNLLVVGIDTVSIANSAKKAGYKVYAADYFGDVDLRHACSGLKTIVKQNRGKSCGRIATKFKPSAFLKMAKSLLKEHKMDAILLSSGLDDHFDILHRLNNLTSILGNSPTVFERVRERPRIFEELERLGIPCPQTAIAKDVDEAKAAASRMGYPVVVKPDEGFGGIGVRIARNTKEMEKTFCEVSSVHVTVLVQEFIDGINASISFLATYRNSKVLAINEQVLGLPFVFPQGPFEYCGNITPLYLIDSVAEKCKNIVEKIALHFDLEGSNGIDVVISKEGKPYVVEVNPRFQSTLECVERALGINLVESHIEACLHGIFPSIREKPTTFCTRLILHAPKRIAAPDLTVFQYIRDIPLSETIIEKGEPLCSIIAVGKNRNSSFQKAKELAKVIYDMVHPA